jgi:hypothetical protein
MRPVAGGRDGRVFDQFMITADDKELADGDRC